MNQPSASSATPIPPGLHRTGYQLPPAPQYPPLPSPANRPLSPPIEDVNAEGSSAIGMELTVVGLDHTSPTSAKTHLERLLRQIHQQKAVPDVIIRKGDVSGNLDYVHVSLHPALSAVPRPDVLQQLLTDINDLRQGAVHAKWRAGRGADKSRRIIFQVNSEEEMRTVHPLLWEWFWSRNFAFQQDRTSNLGGQLCISFDILRSEDIDTILTTPPYVNHHTYHATRPRFVEPTYGGEIAIGGCEVLQNPQAQFNMELRKKYGQDVVRFSRVALEGSTYTVVLRDWQTTNQFLEDFGEGLPSSWTRFCNITVGVPDLLYLFNSVGAPANPSRGAASLSPQVTHLQVQVDELCRQGAETVGTVNQVLAQTWRAVEKQNEVAQQMMASICAVSTSAALSSRYASLESTCGRLEERMVHYRETLEGKPSPAQRIRLDSLLAETEHEYGRVDKEKDTVAQQLSALQFAQGTQFLGQTVPHHNDADPSRPPEHGDDVPMSHERPPPEEDDNQRYEPCQRMSHDGGSAGPSIDANRMEQEVCWPSTVPFTSLLTVTCPLFHSEWVDSGRGQSMVHERAKRRLVPASFSVIRFFFAFTQWLLALASLVSSSAFVILFGLLLLVMVVHASHPLHIISLNANGVGDLMKCNAISSMIHQHRPHIWVINETKSEPLQ
ncbi:hypothetical protein DFH29DRAFT_1006185 [Suillus ampliporus]|nr:hypothetical protein DFH29DRAFT_1006185 [Suillus ampliporus]